MSSPHSNFAIPSPESPDCLLATDIDRTDGVASQCAVAPVEVEPTSSPGDQGEADVETSGAAAFRGKNERQHREAWVRYELLTMYRSLQASGLSPDAAADRVKSVGRGGSRASLDRWAAAYDRAGFAGLLDRRENAGRPRKYELTENEVASLRAVYLRTNRTETSGSVPETIRTAARSGILRPELAEAFLERARTGRMVPESLARDIAVSAAAVKQFRNPTDAGLDYLNSPGALMWITHPSGRRSFAKAGDIIEADDATVNFPVCVPWEIGGDACSERWGVRVARFQWLVTIDRATRYVPGWSYTMRPRSSYRAEDIVALFHGVFQQHGIWKRACLERGSWESNLVEAMLDQLGVERMTAWSPHQKPFIEGLFNLMWTKLSDVGGQVGRYQGEEEATAKVLVSCQRGSTDPRRHFPMLGQAIEAFRRATAERNAQPVTSKHWGTWVPEERWLAQLADARTTSRLRQLPADAAWMFAPEAREWTVKGNTVGGSIQIMEGLSVRFDFAADWLVEFDGYKVRAHFDPSAPKAEATIVLVQSAKSRKPGEVLGTAYQVNETARYARQAMGWGNEEDIGRDQRKQAASALRREVRTIVAGGQTGLSVTHVRDGLGNQAQIVSGTTSTMTPAPSPAPADPQPAPGRESAPVARIRRSSNPFQPATATDFDKARERLARLKAAQEAATA